MEELEYAPYILRAMVDAVFLVDIRDRIVHVNDAATRLLGHSRDQLVGRKLASIFADEAAAIHSSTRIQLMVEGAELHREEVKLRAADDSVIPVSVTGSAVVDANGDLVGIGLVARDLRETHRLVAELTEEVDRRVKAEAELERAKASVEEELERTRKELLHADRLATLGTLAGGLGHELANVATVFTGSLDRILAIDDNLGFPEPLKRAYSNACRHLREHAQRLKELARPGPDYDEPIDLREVVRDTVSMLSIAGRTRRIAVDVDLPEQPVVVPINRTRIEQILVNLVVNSADAIADGGEGGHIRITLTADDELARCTIEDDGCGIPAQDLPRVFDSFFTSKPASIGTGLGLAVVKQIVASYGGDVSIDSAVGEGTRVSFSLPSGTRTGVASPRNQ